MEKLIGNIGKNSDDTVGYVSNHLLFQLAS